MLPTLCLMGLFNFFGCSKPRQSAEPQATPKRTDLKTVNYRGGLVRFSIPANWLEEYEPEGGGTFYEDRPDSGTLRLNVLSFDSPDKPADEMARTAFPQETVERLPSGFSMRRYVKSANEKGQALDIHRWEIAVPVPPHGLRLVCFTHTILAGQQSDTRIATELKLLDASIRCAEFSQQPGVIGAYIK
jgi:hypothetical protein